MSSLSSFIWVKGRLPVSVFSIRVVYVTMERKRERERDHSDWPTGLARILCLSARCSYAASFSKNGRTFRKKLVGNSFSFRGLKGEIKVNEGGNGVLQLL